MIALVVAFALFNSQPVVVDYLVASRESRLLWIITESALLGALADRPLLRRRRR